MRLLFIFILLIPICSQAQNIIVIDSLEKELTNVKGEEKLELLFEVLNKLWETGSDKSIQLGNDAYHLAIKLEKPGKAQLALVYIANAYDMCSDFATSLSYYHKCITQAEETANNNLLSLCYNNVGILNKKIKKYDIALEYYKKSLEVKKILNDSTRQVSTYNNIGQVYSKLGAYEDALNNYENALNLINCFEIKDNNRLIGTKADILTNMGNIFSNYIKDKNNDPLEYFNEALTLRKLSDDRYNETKTLISIGEYYFNKKQFQSMLKYYQQAEIIANELNNSELKMIILNAMANYYYSISEFKQAYENYKMYSIIKDTVFTIEREEMVSDIQTKYETEKKEKENISLKKDNEIQQLMLDKRKTAMYIMSFGIFAVLILLSLIYYFYRKRTIAYKNLVTKNLELAKCDMQILETGEFIPPNVLNTESKETNNSSERSKELELVEKFNTYLSEEKPYLFSDIHIEDIATHLSTNRTYLSKAINSVFNKSFVAIINEFRIRTARQLLTDVKYNHFSIEGIGQMSGYNSRTAFINNFKKITGLTPSYFRDSIPKKD